MKTKLELNRHLTSDKPILVQRQSIIFITLLSLTLLVPLISYSPASLANETTTSKIIDVTKSIITKAAKVGINEAGTRILGSSWRYFEPVIDTLFDELKPKYNNISVLKSDNPGIDSEKLAQRIANDITNDPRLRNLITNGFANLEQGQREIINSVSRLESVLLEQGEEIKGLQKSSDQKLDYLISKVDQLQKERPKMNYTSGITMFDLEGVWTLVEKIPATCHITQGSYGIAINPLNAFQATGNYSLVMEPVVLPSVSDKPVCMNPQMESTISLYGTLLSIPISDTWNLAREVSVSGNKMVLSWEDGDGRTLKWIFNRSP